MTFIVTRRSKTGEARWTVESGEIANVIVSDLVETGSGFPIECGSPEDRKLVAEAAIAMLHVGSPPFPSTRLLLGNSYTVEEIEAFDYPVELSRDDNGTLLVTIPDVPGAITFGESEEAALELAVDALETMLLARMLERKDIPAPSAAHGRPTVRPTLLGTLKIMLYKAMRERGWRKADLARALELNPRQVDRLLDLRHASTVKQLEQALAACGKRADISVRELKAA
ncbi:MAG TPA: type II toxin-antitoxin system HicB family antitoxin [Sphingomicrobium sp.]|nr:type II toxin-antitoxin system HicB family antitoxin [Sphingomicrobium sp.]